MYVWCVCTFRNIESLSARHPARHAWHQLRVKSPVSEWLFILHIIIRILRKIADLSRWKKKSCEPENPADRAQFAQLYNFCVSPERSKQREGEEITWSRDYRNYTMAHNGARALLCRENTEYLFRIGIENHSHRGWGALVSIESRWAAQLNRKRRIFLRITNKFYHGNSPAAAAAFAQFHLRFLLRLSPQHSSDHTHKFHHSFIGALSVFSLWMAIIQRL